MTEYKDLLMDLPGRCADVMRIANKSASELKLYDVTVSLMVAGTAFLMTFERIEDNRHRKREPVGKTAKKMLSNIKKEIFIKTIVSAEFQKDWELKRVENTKPSDQAIYLSQQSQNLVSDATCEEVMYALRNSIAHGGVYPQSPKQAEAGPSQVINRLHFVSNWKESLYHPHGETLGSTVVTTTPKAFNDFLQMWIFKLSDLMKEEDRSQSVGF